jgi:hypothetical protein
VATTLRFGEAADLVDEIIPRTVEQMAESLQTAFAANENPQTVVDAGAELLAYDVVESVNNILKSIFRAAVWTGIPGTAKEAGAKFVTEARKSIVKEAGRVGKNVGPGITKWAKRAALVGVGSTGGMPLFHWIASNYPEAFAWLESIVKLVL